MFVDTKLIGLYNSSYNQSSINMVMSSQTDVEQRFFHLLQPIRDMTKNWDVDIATELEEYLEELEKIEITFDGGATTMNFAEAALLIQGSTCVYSRKVEYLYTLVYQVLDLLANKKKNNLPNSVDGEGQDQDANFNNQEKDEEFLSLDDIQDHKNILIKEDAGRKTTTSCPVPLTPMSLIPLEDGEKGENPLLSKTGEILASRNDFKINTSCVQPSGTLLLDLSHLSLWEMSLKALATSTPFPAATRAVIGQPKNGDVADDTPLAPHDLPDDPPQNMSVDDADEDMGFPEFEPEDKEFIDKQQTSEQPPVVEKIEKRTRARVQIKDTKPKVDLWLLKDPHEQGAMSEKPFKRGLMFKIPAGLESNTHRKRKRTATATEKKFVPITEFIKQSFYSYSSKFPKNALKVPVFAQLDRQYWEEFKRRQSLIKEEKKQLAATLLEEEEGREEEDSPIEAVPDMPDICDDDDENGADDIPLVDDNLFSAMEQALDSQYLSRGLKSVGADSVDLEKGPLITSYEELVQHHVDQYLASAQEYAQITELSRRVAEWEEKVIPKLEEEDSHAPFDINVYGSKVINHMNKGNRVPFRRVAASRPQYEVCRLFLATLMLANTGNVEVYQKGILDEGIDLFELELLTTRRHFEELAEYQAPSIITK
ncbi:hypothetical protein ScPMuIL_015482 [Solemya velum]